MPALHQDSDPCQGKDTLCLKQSNDPVSGSIPAKSQAIIYYFTSHIFGLFPKEYCMIVLCGDSNDLVSLILCKNTELADY